MGLPHQLNERGNIAERRYLRTPCRRFSRMTPCCPCRCMRHRDHLTTAEGNTTHYFSLTPKAWAISGMVLMDQSRHRSSHQGPEAPTDGGAADQDENRVHLGPHSER